jgi:uncharacterized repeat protein (TIGR01451 family)
MKLHSSLLLILAIFTPGMVLAQPKPASKLPSIVEQLVNTSEWALHAGIQDVAGLSNDVLHVSPSGDIELLFHATTPTGSAEEVSLQALGATIVTRLASPPGLNLPPVGIIQAWVPYEQVHAAAALPWVVAVTPPDYGFNDPHPNNPINSEGVALHRANLAHAAGITGAGVTVGVISNGVTNLAAAQALNELPAVTVFNAGAGDEGTAMLEIVHDMAPGAALLFDTGAGVMGHVNALNNLVANGANVITEDLFFLAQPAFQQGIAAATAESIAAGGVSVHSSAGNRGREHAARVPAVGTGGGPDGIGGPFAGCGPSPPLNTVAIAPGGDTTFDVIIPGGTVANPSSSTFALQWSEPRAIFPTVGRGGFTDLDLYIMDMTGTTCFGTSTGGQAFGVGDTIEIVTLSNTGAAIRAKIVVNVFGSFGAVAPPTLNLTWFNALAVDAPTRAGSLNPDSNYIGLATSAAAVNANTGLIEGFSSGGPVQLGSTTICAGGAAGPCVGVAGLGLMTFPGPTWAAADGVSVSGVGGFGSPFFGTSASAPHAAACDALVRQALGNPPAPAGLVKDILAGTAIDIVPPGIDNVSGAGLLDCFAATVEANRADLSITKEGNPDPVKVGGELTHRIRVRNLGPSNATGVILTDTLPANINFVSASSGCSRSGSIVTCEIGNMSDGESAVRLIRVRPTAPGGFSNTATVRANETDPDSANNTVTTVTTVR